MIRSVALQLPGQRLADLPVELGILGVLAISFLLLVGILTFFGPVSFREWVTYAVRLPAYERLYQDFVSYYGDRTTYPQDRRSILGTFVLGGVLVVGSLSVVFTLVTLPILFGYYVRELGWVVHSREDRTVLQDPFQPDRPAFRDFSSMAVDGIKFAAAFLLYGATAFLTWYAVTAVLDVVFLVGIAGAVGAVAGSLVALAGIYVLPAFLARFAHSGKLGEAVSQPFLFLFGRRPEDALGVGDGADGANDVEASEASDAGDGPDEFDVLSNVPDGGVLRHPTYAREALLGTVSLVLPLAVVGVTAINSLLLVPIVAFPLVFVLTLQAMDHYGRGYRGALGLVEEETERAIHPDSFALPFRDGTVVTADRDRSILVMGETGSGKTEAIKLLADQFPTHEDAPLIAFDYKRDYREFFGGTRATTDGGTRVDDAAAQSVESGEPSPGLEAGEAGGDDVVVLSLEDSTHVWNLFREVDEEEEFEEIGRALFAQEERESSNPFFPKAARQVFVALLKYLYRWANDDPELPEPNNAMLVRTVENKSVTEIHELLTEDSKYARGLSGAAGNINPEAPRQAAGVYGHLQTLMTEVFKGDFAERGEFSVREFMRDPDGRTLILDYPIESGESVKPVFRFYIDWAIRYGLADPNQEAFFVLDEFQTIPGLERIERLVNVGRARQAYGILGLQSKKQLQSTYGEAEAESILSGLAQEVLLRPGDDASVDHIRSRTGRVQRERLVQGPTSFIGKSLTGRTAMFNQVTTEEEYQVSEAELQRLDPGEAIVVHPDGWRRGHLYMLEEVRTALALWRARWSEDAESEGDGTGDVTAEGDVEAAASGDRTDGAEGTSAEPAGGSPGEAGEPPAGATGRPADSEDNPT